MGYFLCMSLLRDSKPTPSENHVLQVVLRRYIEPAPNAELSFSKLIHNQSLLEHFQTSSH